MSPAEPEGHMKYVKLRTYLDKGGKGIIGNMQ